MMARRGLDKRELGASAFVQITIKTEKEGLTRRTLREKANHRDFAKEGTGDRV
jgi:hypothetical protein